MKSDEVKEINEIKSDHQSNNNTADGILMLNDDCFLHIFKYLSLIDVGNFKEAYASLAAIAHMEYRRRTRGTLRFDVEEKLDEALTLTRQFGSSATGVGINYSRLGGTKCCEIFSVIGEHCTENLKLLFLVGETFGRIKEDDIDMSPITDVLKNIETLRNLDALSSLNGLFLLFAKLDESSVTTLARMTRLNILYLESCDLPTSSHFESLLVLCGSKNLEHFLCYSNDSTGNNSIVTIDEVNFLQLVEKRKASGADKCLTLYFAGTNTTFVNAVPLELLEANKETIDLIVSPK